MTKPYYRGDLGFAANRGDFAAVKEMVDNGADVNERVHGMTPLIWGAQSGNPDIVRLLIAKGANVNERNTTGDTPLYRAASSNRTEAIALLLDNGAHIDESNSEGVTPLIAAARNGRAEAARLLLDRGANPLLVDQGRHDAYYYAVHNKWPKVEVILAAAVEDYRRLQEEKERQAEREADRAISAAKQEQLKKRAPHIKPRGPKP